MTLPVVLERAGHSISRNKIDPDVLKVLYRLHHAGFAAYLVGGSVRDLLLGRKPKDFDIGTDAHPAQVKSLFRNCRIIGRRFRLAHVLFGGGKVVEVATFRRRPDASDEPGADLLVREDNAFGTPVEDALRRDFTINGLFYDIATFSVIDYVGGLPDLDNRILRVIGEPAIRFREDPVRMLRAVEFAARLDFTLTLDTHDAIVRHRGEISRSAPPRVTEELLGMLRGPHPLATFRLLREVGLLEILLPDLVAAIAAHTDPVQGEDGTLFWKYLAILERRQREGKGPASDAILFGILLLPLVFSAISSHIRKGKPLGNAELMALIEETTVPSTVHLTIPNMTLATVRQAIFLLGQLDEPARSPAAARRILARSSFPVAFDLFRMHAEATGRHGEAVERWERLRHAPPAGDREPPPSSDAPEPDAPGVEAGSEAAGRKRRRTRRPRRRSPAGEPAEAGIRFEDDR